MTKHRLDTHPIHLGLGACAEVEPAFTGDMAWYEAYTARHDSDGREARLVSLFSFDAPWDMWEMHPKGDEVVLCLSGEMTLIQEDPDGSRREIAISAGEYAINDAGVWHTADAERDVTALFITAGLGTEHRPR